jgi:uncharacterized protein (UPF0276 family)
MERFAERVARLPRLGIGISTEHGAARVGTHPVALRDAHPRLVDFLEVGADLDRGVDDDTRAWVARGWPTTYHFLDVNLEEPADLDQPWVEATVALARSVGAAWLCGDAGLWHVGPRDRGHGTLLPPILCRSSAEAMVEAVIALRERSGFEVLPENPPAHVLVGDLHPLRYFGWVADRADCGLLLDVAHLAIVQAALGLEPTALLDDFPVERVVELHVAGGTEFRSGGRRLIHDDHGPRVHEHTWALLERLLPRATALRAVVVECERNTPAEVVALFEEVRRRVALPVAPPREPPPVADIGGPPVDHRATQRTLFRMLLDPSFARQVRAGVALPVPDPAASWLRGLDRELVAADPDQGRVRQLLGNVGSELAHTIRAAPPFLEDFPASPEFHRAIAEDTPLTLALAAFADRVLPEGPWRALLALDAAMARVRRSRQTEVVDLPEGTVSAAAGERSTLGPDRERAAVYLAGGAVEVEVVGDAIAELLTAGPLTDDVRAAFAARHEVDRAAVDELVADLRRDGLLS